MYIAIHLFFIATVHENDHAFKIQVETVGVKRSSH